MQKTIVTSLIPRTSLVLAIIACGIMLSLFLWGLLTPGNAYQSDLPILAGVLVLGVYLTLKLSTYRLIFYNDRIIRKLWGRQHEILYKDIDELIIDDSCCDAAQLGKALGPSISDKLKKYQIFDVRIIGNGSNIHFRSKWFDSPEQANYALSFLLEKCPPQQLKRGRDSDSYTANDLISVIKWIVLLFILTYAASFIFPS